MKLTTVPDALCPVNADRWQMMDFFGREFYPFDPRPDDINIEEIAHILSQMRRYTCQSAVSVAQHSVIVSELLAKDGWSIAEQLDGLLHDCHEAYIGDFARPLARTMVFRFDGFDVTLEELRSRLDKAIYAKLWPQIFPVCVRSGTLQVADNVAALWEARDILRTPLSWAKNHKYTLPNNQLWVWGATKAKDRFLEDYKVLCHCLI